MRRVLLVALLVFFVWPAHNAVAQKFGDWLIDTRSKDFLYASTINDNGVFGQYCYFSNDKCLWLLVLDAECERGDQYPVLVNTDSGSAALNIHCGGGLDGGLYRYVFTDFDGIDALANKGSLIGFALPMYHDQFRVVRFKLNGAARALDAMHSAFEKKTSRADTRDRLF